MSIKRQMPVALTIAGSDSGGGAGIQADLKVFAALGVHGTSAITALTAQNPQRVSAVVATSPQMVREQIQAVREAWEPAAVKTGMLGNDKIIAAVLDVFGKDKWVKLVVDPVMVSTSGRALLNPAGVKLLKERLLARAVLVTPNLAEAEILAGMPVKTIEQMRTAARKIFEAQGCAVLLKGGHVKGANAAADIFYDGNEELLLTAPYQKNLQTHGTGCTLSAAITGYLARGETLREAVILGKEFITEAIGGSKRVGDHLVLDYHQFK